MPKNVDFLKKLHEISENKMRWHSDIEYRLLKMFIIINPAIITAIFGIYKLIENGDTNNFQILTNSIAVFLIILTLTITIKIYAEHRTYHNIGQQIVRIWEYFDLFKNGVYLRNDTIMDEKAKTYGKGLGYIWTLLILWAMTLTTAIILISFGCFKL